MTLLTKAMRACQLLLCPDFKTCEDALKDDEKCACGFEGGPAGNSVPPNRAAEIATARAEKVRAELRLVQDIVLGQARSMDQILARAEAAEKEVMRLQDTIDDKQSSDDAYNESVKGGLP